MIKHFYFRLSLLVAVVGATALLCFFMPDAKVSNETGVILSLPEYIDGYDSELIPMSEKEKEWLPPSTRHTKRVYYKQGARSDFSSKIEFSIIVSGGDERSLHRPEVCLNGQGWAIPKKEIRTIIHAGKILEIMDLSLTMVANGETYRAHYYFFWVGRGISTPNYSDMKWFNLWDNFSKNMNHRWAYPGIFVGVNDTAQSPRQDAWRRAQYILRESLSHFHLEFGAVKNL